jgi:hypothetical protein
MNHYPTNLYRDDEVKNYVTSYISDSKKNYLKQAILEDLILPPISLNEGDDDVIDVGKDDRNYKRN